MVQASLLTTPVSLSFAQKHDYDVIVVGAGPAGSSAAYHLAKQGVDVLLVDRYAFPRDKCCGDAVMPPAMEELLLMGIADDVQHRYAAAKRIGVELYGLPPNYSPVDASDHFGEGYIAPRASFDALLCNHALQQGASWLHGVTVQRIEENEQADFIEVQGVHEEQRVRFRCRIVIAADGSGSRLARQLRQKLLEEGDMDALTASEDSRVRFTAMRGYYTGIEDIRDTLEFYFRTDPGIHYYWIFPLLDGTANVGIIASQQQLRADRPDLTQALEKFVQTGNERSSKAVLSGKLRAAPIAAGMRGTALYGDHILCVGDAAALVHPVSAEGISEALTSGRLAAETALVALASANYSKQALRPYAEAIRSRYEALYDGFLAGAGNTFFH